MACVNEGSHSFTCHRHVYPQVEWAIPAFTPQPHSINTLWPVLSSRQTEDRRLSWPGWLSETLRWFAIKQTQTVVDVETVEPECTANCSRYVITTKLLSQRHRARPGVTTVDLWHDLVSHHDLWPGLDDVAVHLHYKAGGVVGECEVLSSAWMTATAINITTTTTTVTLYTVTQKNQASQTNKLPLSAWP